jgi:hypothetical protein
MAGGGVESTTLNCGGGSCCFSGIGLGDTPIAVAFLVSPSEGVGGFPLAGVGKASDIAMPGACCPEIGVGLSSVRLEYELHSSAAWGNAWTRTSMTSLGPGLAGIAVAVVEVTGASKDSVAEFVIGGDVNFVSLLLGAAVTPAEASWVESRLGAEDSLPKFGSIVAADPVATGPSIVIPCSAPAEVIPASVSIESLTPFSPCISLPSVACWDRASCGLSFKEVVGPGDREAGMADDGVEADVSGLEVEEGAETCKAPTEGSDPETGGWGGRSKTEALSWGSCSDFACPSGSALLPRTSRESSTGAVISSVFAWTSAGAVMGTSSSSSITIGARSEPGSGVGAGAGAREVIRNLRGVAEEPFRVDPCLKSRYARFEDGA